MKPGAVLVADVGGTHTRVGRFDGALRQVETWPTSQTPSLRAALRHYEALHPGPVAAAGVAIAGPVQGPSVSLTNVDWTG